MTHKIKITESKVQSSFNNVGGGEGTKNEIIEVQSHDSDSDD